MLNEGARLPGIDSPGGTEQRAGPAADDVLVIGVGNDLRGDDGAGQAVIRELARAKIPGLRALWSHQLVPELVEPIAGARLVVFVDAAYRDTAPAPPADGVIVRPIRPRPPSIGGHQAEPGALLGLAQLAGLPVPQAYLISIPGQDFDLGARLSPPTRAAVSRAVHSVLQLLGQHHEASVIGSHVETTSDGAQWTRDESQLV